MPSAWTDFEPVEETPEAKGADWWKDFSLVPSGQAAVAEHLDSMKARGKRGPLDWQDFEPAPGRTEPFPETQAQRVESAAMLAGEGRPETGMEAGTELITAIGHDPVAFAKSLPSIIAGAVSAPGELAYYTAADVISKVAGQPEYGGNIKAMEAGADLPADRFVAESARTNPKLALAAKLGKSAAEMAPMAGMAALPAWANRLIAIGFSAQMISGAPELFRQYAEEINKPKPEQDPDKLTSLQSGIIQTLTFAPLLGAGAVHARGVAEAGAPATAEALKGAVALGSELKMPAGAEPIAPAPETPAAKSVSTHPPPGDSGAVGQRGEEAPLEEKADAARQEKEVAFDPAKTGPITAAAYKDPETGEVWTGPNHPAILTEHGLPVPPREQRNTPAFGFQTANEPFVPRDQAGPIAEAHNQKLDTFDQGDTQPHADQVAAKPGGTQPLADSPVPQGDQVATPHKPAPFIDLQVLAPPVNRVATEALVGLAENARQAQILKAHSIKRIVIDYPDRFDLSTQATFDPRNGQIRLNAEAELPVESIFHEVGHARWMDLTGNQRIDFKLAWEDFRKSNPKEAEGLVGKGYVNDYDEAHSELFSKWASDPKSVPAQFSELFDQPVSISKREQPLAKPYRPPTEKAVRDIAKGEGLDAWITDKDDVAGSVSKYGDFMVVVKDTYGHKHLMPASVYAEFEKNPTFNHATREVWVARKAEMGPVQMSNGGSPSIYAGIQAVLGRGVKPNESIAASEIVHHQLPSPASAKGGGGVNPTVPATKEGPDETAPEIPPLVKAAIEKNPKQAEWELLGATPKPVPATPAKPTFPAELAKRLLALPRERQTSGYGEANAELRRDILEALTGARPPKAKAGAKATQEALAKHFGIDTENLAGAEIEEAIRDRLKQAVNEGKPVPALTPAEDARLQELAAKADDGTITAKEAKERAALLAKMGQGPTDEGPGGVQAGKGPGTGEGPGAVEYPDGTVTQAFQKSPTRTAPPTPEPKEWGEKAAELMTPDEASSKPIIRIAGQDIGQDFLHGTKSKNLQTLTALVRPESSQKKRSQNLILEALAPAEQNEFNAELLLSEPRQAHQAVAFSSGKGEALASVRLKAGTKILDLSDEATRAPTVSFGGPEVIRFFKRPAITDDLIRYYKTLVGPGYKERFPDWESKIEKKTDPDSPEFNADTWRENLVRYAKARGYGAIRFVDEILVADRSALESARKATQSEAEAAKTARAFPGGKITSLFHDKPSGATKEWHSYQIEQAAKNGNPVSAVSVDAYGIKLPDGYIKEGDIYVFKPEAKPPESVKEGEGEAAEPPPTEQAIQQVLIEIPKTPQGLSAQRARIVKLLEQLEEPSTTGSELWAKPDKEETVKRLRNKLGEIERQMFPKKGGATVETPPVQEAVAPMKEPPAVPFEHPEPESEAAKSIQQRADAASKVEDELYEKLRKAEEEEKSAGYGTKRREAAEKRAQKLREQGWTAMSENAELHQQRREMAFEHLARTGSTAKKWAAIPALLKLRAERFQEQSDALREKGDRQGADKAYWEAKRLGDQARAIGDEGFELMRADASRRLQASGATKEEADFEALQIANMQVSYPHSSAMRNVEMRMRAIEGERTKAKIDAEVDAVMKEYGVMHDDQFRNRIRFALPNEKRAREIIGEFREKYQARKDERLKEERAIEAKAKKEQEDEIAKAKELAAKGKLQWTMRGNVWRAIEGKPIKLKADPARNYFIYKSGVGEWSVVESSTGRMVGSGKVQADAVTMAEDRIAAKKAEYDALVEKVSKDTPPKPDVSPAPSPEPKADPAKGGLTLARYGGYGFTDPGQQWRVMRGKDIVASYDTSTTGMAKAAFHSVFGREPNATELSAAIKKLAAVKPGPGYAQRLSEQAKDLLTRPEPAKGLTPAEDARLQELAAKADDGTITAKEAKERAALLAKMGQGPTDEGPGGVQAGKGPGTGEGPGSPAASEVQPTGASADIFGVRQVTREKMEKAGQPVVAEPLEGVSLEDSLADGRARLAQDPGEAERVRQNYDRTGRLSAADFNVARAKYQEIIQAGRRIEEKFGTDSPEYKAARDAAYLWSDLTKRMQSEVWHRMGMGQQGETDIDTGNLIDLETEYHRQTGEDFTPSQKSAAGKIAKGVKEADKKVEAAKPKLDDAIEGIREKGERPPYSDVVIRIAEKIVAKLDARATASRKALDEMGLMFSAGVDPVRTAKMLGHFANIGASHIGHYGLDFIKWSDAMVKDLGPKLEGVLKQAGLSLKQVFDESEKLVNAEGDQHGPQADEVKAAVKKTRKSAVPTDLKEQQKAFSDFESGKPMSPTQVKTLWTRAKQDYIDKGNDNKFDIVHKLATDFGIPAKDVLRGLSQNWKVKRVADDVWQKQKQARLLKQAAKNWLQHAQDTWLQKAIPNTAKVAFSAKVNLHGTVALGTHGPLTLATHPVIFSRNFGKMYKLVTSPEYYEMQVYEQAQRPNYSLAQRAGLVNDMSKMEDFSDPRLAIRFPKGAEWFREKLDKIHLGRLVGMGTRGYSVLKILRQDLFDHEWDKLAESEKEGPPGVALAKAIADSVNHITGITSTKMGTGWNYFFFAPRLELSRLKVIAGDPARAASRAVISLLKMEAMTPAEKWFATNQLKQAAKIFAVSQGLLIANQQLNSLFGDKKKLNGVPTALGGAGYNPMASDFMKFRVAGMNVAWGSPFLTMARLPLRIVQIGMGSGGKTRYIIYPDESMYKTLGTYVRTKESPFISPIASLLMKADYQGRPLPQIPGYGEPPPVPKRLQAEDVEPYTWTEFAAETVLPIPFEEGAKEIFHQTMSPEPWRANSLLKPFITIMVMGATGARLHEDWNP
jgi:hypothetical protein